MPGDRDLPRRGRAGEPAPVHPDQPRRLQGAESPKQADSLKAVTFDYWDTLYAGATSPERVELRRSALRYMLTQIGAEVAAEEFDRLYKASGREADRWWRDEHRGYTTADRIRWILSQLAIERPAECEHIARAVETVDDTLIEIAPPLLPGATDAIQRLSQRFKLGIISDTGFASGHAQNRLLNVDGLLSHFSTT